MFLPKEEGQGWVEYALILILVGIIVIAALTALGGTVGDLFDEITRRIGGS